MSVSHNITGKILSNRYEILRPLGEGGMGKVYLAKDKRLGKQVVVKVPTMEAGDKDFKDRFLREIGSLARLEHAHIVPTMDWGEMDGIPFLVLRYLAGGSLRDRITDVNGYYKPMPLEGLNQWLPQIASALDFIHSKKWVHRDLKPDNILFDEAGNPYLADFGIAKALEGAPMGVKTTMGAILGTPQYMSPEMHLGKGIGPKADQFGLAVLVYEALAGKIPFAGTTPTAIFVEVMQGKARPIHEVVPGISLENSNALMRGITKEPRDRFESCVEFANKVLAGSTTSGIVKEPSKVEYSATRIETPAKAEFPGGSKETPLKGKILRTRIETPAKGELSIGSKETGLSWVQSLTELAKAELPIGSKETPVKAEILRTRIGLPPKARATITRLEQPKTTDNRSPNFVENSNGKKSILSTIGVWTGSLALFGLFMIIMIFLIGYMSGNNLAKKSFNQGLENSKLKQYDKAIADYTRAIELDPKLADAYYNRGVDCGKLKQYDKAIGDYTKAIELDPKSANAYYGRGVAYANLNQFDKAITDYTKAIELDPKSAWAYNKRGETYLKVGKKKEAEADFAKAKKLKEDD